MFGLGCWQCLAVAWWLVGVVGEVSMVRYGLWRVFIAVQCTDRVLAGPLLAADASLRRWKEKKKKKKKKSFTALD